MRRALEAALLMSTLLACPRMVSAGPIYDFGATSNGTVTALGPAALLPGGIIAYGFVSTDALEGGPWVLSTLIARNEGFEDVGLGVCSEGANECAIGGSGSGDNNELSQLLSTEAILLQRPVNTLWSGLWLSSLDAGGTNSSERGLLYWTNETGTSLSAPYSFAYPHFGLDAFGQLVLPGEFDPSALFLFFLPGGAVGENNDYLVWGADLQTPNVVPEPGTLTALLAGAALGGLARRRWGGKRP